MKRGGRRVNREINKGMDKKGNIKWWYYFKRMKIESEKRWRRKKGRKGQDLLGKRREKRRERRAKSDITLEMGRRGKIKG